ncbi:MAG TPA: CRTAC1 family protein, partial [Candidatus Polarisedimenticolaceae bacterium]|nr:CRTAC1 family protein [Candidatus Polarisedimenticolaceae bacterium]
LYRNNGDGTFTDVAPAAGVADERWGVTAGWSDVDLDGDLDLYVTNYVVFTFERYPIRGAPMPDGKPPCMWRGIEVYCGPRTLIPEADVLFRNDGDTDGDGVPSFVDRTRDAGLLLDEAHFGLGVLFFDGDGDGDGDLYVANDSVRNLYFVNDGRGRFLESSILAGVAYNEQGNEQAGMGLASGDYDRDGRFDLAVTNFSHDHDTLYHNDGNGYFTDLSYPAGIGSPSFLTLGWGIAFVDLDQDGWEDLYVCHGHVYPQVDDYELGTSYRQPNAVFRNSRDGTFEPLDSAGAGQHLVKSSRALAPVDLDGDGDLDLLVTSLNDSPDLLLNDGATGNWLQLRLIGRRSSRDGIGARVILDSAGERQYREVRRSTGFAASTLPIAHFGLGPATTIERVEVRWPSGAVSQLTDLPANRRVEVVEP